MMDQTLDSGGLMTPEEAKESKRGEEAIKRFDEIIPQRATAQLMGYKNIQDLKHNYQGTMWRALSFMLIKKVDDETIDRLVRLFEEMLQQDKDAGFAREVQKDLQRQNEHFSKYPMDEPCYTPGCCGNPEEVDT